MKLRSKVTKIVEEVFQHGKLTPNKSYNLPKGQITIVDAINELEALYQQTMGEIIGEADKIPTLPTRFFIESMRIKNKLRAFQRARLEKLLT